MTHNNITIIYDYKRKCELICPIELYKATGLLYDNATDKHIELALESGEFIDTLKYKHGQDTSTKEHALIIASLVILILKNIDVGIIPIFPDETNENIEIEDGCHRIRAYVYIKKYINNDILMPVETFYD